MYLKSLFDKRKEVFLRMQERKRKKEEQQKRGSKAQQKRLQTMAVLGIEDQDQNQSKKRGRPSN